MARAQRPKSTKSDGKADAIIRAYTESVERIGADPAFFGIMAVVGCGALAVGANAWAVCGLMGILSLCWIGNKWVNAHIFEKNAKLELQRLRADRGGELLKQKKPKPVHLQLLSDRGSKS